MFAAVSDWVVHTVGSPDFRCRRDLAGVRSKEIFESDQCLARRVSRQLKLAAVPWVALGLAIPIEVSTVPVYPAVLAGEFS